MLLSIWTYYLSDPLLDIIISTVQTEDNTSLVLWMWSAWCIPLYHVHVYMESTHTASTAY